MFKLWATIIKDFKILLRDRVGLTLMFAMPIVLVLVITSLQVSTFELVNENKVKLLIGNNDNGIASKEFVGSISKSGMFQITYLKSNALKNEISNAMNENDALVCIIIPSDFSKKMQIRAKEVSSKALNDFGLVDTVKAESQKTIEALKLFYHPVLQESYRKSINGALRSALQIVESKQILKSLYFSLNEKELPSSLENQIIGNQIPIEEIPVSKNGNKSIPNATQHNIPAWTIFAMFFVVTSLGSTIVKEKVSGSFVRLKTLPTTYLISLLSKQITYLGVCLSQVLVIFSIGIWLFPLMGLPKLNMPSDFANLIIVSIICGWCAVSYAICIGVFANSQEQANGFGAVSIVILAAVGGILVPSFAMPNSFQFFMKLSPLHWCLESYYEIFLEGGNIIDNIYNLLPLLAIITVIQIVTIIKLKIKNLI